MNINLWLTITLILVSLLSSLLKSVLLWRNTGSITFSVFWYLSTIPDKFRTQAFNVGAAVIIICDDHSASSSSLPSELLLSIEVLMSTFDQNCNIISAQ